MGILDRIKDIEDEINRTQKNKGALPATISCNCLATEHHLGVLKAKLARYRAELIEGPKTSKSEVFWVCSFCFSCVRARDLK